jgi:hypothetical protein
MKLHFYRLHKYYTLFTIHILFSWAEIYYLRPREFIRPIISSNVLDFKLHFQLNINVMVFLFRMR